MAGYEEYYQGFLFTILFFVLTPFLGIYLAHVFQGKRTIAHPLLGWLEEFSYRIGSINPAQEMTWREYLKALFIINILGFSLLFILLVTQYWLPLNPQKFPGVPWPLAFNIAASFTTNTDWQSYAGETTLSYATQMVGLGVQNFLSAATSSAALLALIRGFTRKQTDKIGNFYVDFVRTIVYVLLPLSLILALLLVGEGVVQTFGSYVTVTTVEGSSQTIPLGPVASHVAIKQLGSNGGGFFNANSAHPFENPTPFSNLLQLLAIVLIPAALVVMFGQMIGSKRHARILLLVMTLFWSGGMIIASYSERLPNPIVQASPYLEGKETRFGLSNSLLWTISATGTSNGSVNSMISSLSPLAGGVALLNIRLGQLFYGGVGAGLISMVMYVLLTMFMAGLMIGRTPEYLGKKIEKVEVQWVSVAILTPTILTLLGAGFSTVSNAALSSLGNSGPHGLSEILYAFTSTAGNNGSSFASLQSNTLYYNLILGLIMLLARGATLVPAVALAGVLAKKKRAPHTVGTFSTDSWLFAILLFGVILILGALSFFPAMALGPILEQLLMLENRGF